jgi:hypothetical protein
LAFIEYADLISGAKAPAAELVRKLVERYNFTKYPKTVEEFNLAKGVEFLEGSADGYAIQKLAIWDTLTVIETRVHTDVSKAILEEMLSWAAKEFGLNYPYAPIKQFGYISDVTFYSDVPILDVNPAVTELARKCSTALSAIWQQPLVYEPYTVRVGHDPTARKNPLAPFVIEHRQEARFSENKYFSEAPLPTDMHWSLLEQFEKDMLMQ